jgi:lysophospholipase L1-like esterase
MAPEPPEASGVPIHLLVIGDSIPFAEFCPGCTGFVSQYAEELRVRTGRRVEVVNRSRNDSAGMTQIETQLTDEETLRDQVVRADVVLVSVGYNNALPDATTWADCPGDMGGTVESYVAWALKTTKGCLEGGVEAYAAQYDRIFGTITQLRDPSTAVLAAINVHDGNLGGPDLRAAKLSAKTRSDLDRWMIDVYDRWNTMLCRTAAEHGFACIDVYHAFNGPKGDHPSGANTADGAHPSQAGNDVIADLLARLDITAITR